MAESSQCKLGEMEREGEWVSVGPVDKRPLIKGKTEVVVNLEV